MPKKDNSAIDLTEKQVKAILNKMTKEKFERLSDKMCDIPISSFEILVKIIHFVFEKAIYEPSFGEIYAELCVRLSQKAKRNPFVKVIESDEESPVDGEEVTVYRWSNDVTTDDAEIIGPFKSVEECLEMAIDATKCPSPFLREDLELELHRLIIHQGQFVKIMNPVGDDKSFYTVFFPVSKADEIGQQFSKEFFYTERECMKHGNKRNAFKVILLNKCQDEFNKKGIYEDWKKEKKEYDSKKSSLPESEQREKGEELEFRRMKIKKQMLGNIRFIGELYKKDMLKVKVMRYCIETLLKLEERDDGNLENSECWELLICIAK
jgi:translation initiation factor 4G